MKLEAIQRYERDIWSGFSPRIRELLQPTRVRGTIAAGAIGVMLGLFLVAQWQSNVDLPATATSRPAITRDTIDRLEVEQVHLKQQITDLRAKDAADQQALTNNSKGSGTFDRDLSDQRALAGTAPLKGSGIEILLDDSTSTALVPSDTSDNYIVHEYQIRDIANSLWQAGAVGISVNGERFVNSTSVYCVGSTILINDTRTSPPYHIQAVGEPSRLRAALEDGNVLRDIKSRVAAYGIVFQITKTGPVMLPAFDGSIAMRHTFVSQ